MNRLVQATGAQYGTKDYVYDKIGNILEKDGLTYTYGENGAGPHAVTSLSDGTTLTYDDNGNMISKSQSSSLTEYQYDAENRLTAVIKDSNLIAHFAYDGDGGRTEKTIGGVDKIVYVGSLYEEDAVRDTKFVFLGDMRVASMTHHEPLFYHSDHLGGANVMEDKDGVVRELIEYKPFGEFSRRENPGDPHEVAHNYFTGQKLDDETGLYFYEARYYDPVLGRFLTPDTIVQKPENPQTLNRYSYVGNNPVNRVDPTGHFFKKFFKKVWKAIKKPLIAVATAAAVTFTWGAAAPGITGAAALFSSSGFTTVAAAGATTAVLQTHAGQQFTRFLSTQIFDDVLGFSPRAAAFLGSITGYMGVNMGFQFGFARVAGANKAITKVKDFDPNSPVDRATADGILGEGKGINYGTSPKIDPQSGDFKDVSSIFYKGKEAVGVGAEALQIGGRSQHLGIVIKGLQMESQMASFFANLGSAAKAVSQGYLTFGISHTAVNVSLLNSAYHTTISNLLEGGWSTNISTYVYGPYGGGLPGALIYEKKKDIE